MDNALAPLNLNALRTVASDEPNYGDLMSMLRAKRQMYSNMGMSSRDMQSLMEIELRNNPRIAMMLMGDSGNLMRGRALGELEGITPEMLMARLGIEHGGARAGVSGTAVRLPTGVKTMPGAADFGYSTPMMGGNLDVGGYYGLAPSPTPMYGVNVRYNKEF